MKIVYLHQYFKTPSESGGTRSYEMAKRLALKGHEVHIITSSTNPDATSSSRGWSTEIVEGFQIHRIAVPYNNTFGFSKRIRAFLKFAISSARKARMLRAQLLFATSTPLTIILPAVYAKAFRKIKIVFEVRDLWPEIPIAVGALENPLLQKIALALEKYAYRNSAEIIALSPGMREGIIATGYLGRVTVVPNASDLELFDVPQEAGVEWRRQHNFSADRPIILYCGTLGYVNHIDYFAEVAIRMLTIDPNIAFVVIGDGAEKKAVFDIARSAGILDVNFYMFDAVAKSSIPAALSASTISTSFVIPIPEMEFNSANKFFDSLAAGRPVAINHGGWQADLLEEWGAGLQLSSTDARAAAHSLAQIIAAPNELKKMAEQSRELAEANFDRDKLANRLIAVLERVGPRES